jgi:hypothetical protein
MRCSVEFTSPSWREPHYCTVTCCSPSSHRLSYTCTSVQVRNQELPQAGGFRTAQPVSSLCSQKPTLRLRVLVTQSEKKQKANLCLHSKSCTMHIQYNVFNYIMHHAIHSTYRWNTSFGRNWHWWPYMLRSGIFKKTALNTIR